MTRAGDVVLYLPRLPMGGIERVTVTLANHWAAEGRAVTLLLDRAEGALLGDLRADVPLVSLGVARTAHALPALLGYLRAARPRLLHSALPWNTLVALAAGHAAGVPVSVAEHSLAGAKLGAKARLLPPLMRRAYPRAHAWLAPSGVVADDMARMGGVRRDRVRVVGNPVVPASPPAWTPGRCATGRFVAIGRLAAIKDFATLLRAFRLVLDRAPARLTLLGEGPERAALTALARALSLGDALSMPGVAADPWPHLADADALVVSSVSEGFGNTVVEAMACGTPVVATRCGGPEALLDGGALGHLVPVGDARALADAMLAEPPGTAAARRAAAAAFTVPAVAERTWAAFGLD